MVKSITIKTYQIFFFLFLLIPFISLSYAGNLFIADLQPKYQKTNFPNNITNLDINEITDIKGELVGGWIKPAQPFNLIKINDYTYLAQIEYDGYKRGIFFEIEGNYVMSLSAHHCSLNQCANRNLDTLDASDPVALNDDADGYRIKNLSIEFNENINNIDGQTTQEGVNLYYQRNRTKTITGDEKMLFAPQNEYWQQQPLQWQQQLFQ